MGKIKVAMLEEDCYVSAFAAYVGQHRENWMELHCFTETGNLEKYMSDAKINVLLIGEKFAREVNLDKQIQKVILLSEGNSTCEGGEYSVIFKYQSAKDLLRELCGEIAAGEGFPVAPAAVRGCDKEFIGIYSPWGGCESSLYAVALCKENKHLKNALYVNLHMLSNMHVQDKEKGNAVKKNFGMSELIYYIRQGKENAELKLRSVVRDYKGIDSIYPVCDYRDLYAMSEEDVKILFDILLHENNYGMAVFDIGFLSETSLLFMKLCDRVYLPEPLCEPERVCFEAFNGLLLKEGMDELMASCKSVKMGKGGGDI